jgi:hypothetical protein
VAARKKKRSGKVGVTPARLEKLALALPGTEAGTSYGTPAYRVRKKLFARLLEGSEAVVLKIDFEDRDLFHRGDPKTFYWTDHYQNYPMMIVQLARVHPDDLRELLENAWRREAGKKQLAAFDAVS